MQVLQAVEVSNFLGRRARVVGSIEASEDADLRLQEGGRIWKV